MTLGKLEELHKRTTDKTLRAIVEAMARVDSDITRSAYRSTPDDRDVPQGQDRPPDGDDYNELWDAILDEIAAEPPVLPDNVRKRAALEAIPGLTIADCLMYFDSIASERDREIVALANEECADIDSDGGENDNAIHSEGDDNGTYILTWTWFSFEGTKFDKEKEEEGQDRESYSDDQDRESYTAAGDAG